MEVLVGPWVGCPWVVVVFVVVVQTSLLGIGLDFLFAVVTSAYLPFPSTPLPPPPSVTSHISSTVSPFARVRTAWKTRAMEGVGRRRVTALGR